MNGGWKQIRVGDLGKVVTGRTPSSQFPEFFGTDFPFITPTDIDGQTVYATTERFLSPQGYESQKRIVLPPDSVCFVCIGATIGKICLTKQPSFTNQQINSIVVDKSNHDHRFVFHLLRWNAERIKGIAGGAATPIVNKSAFSDVDVVVPGQRVQQRIGKILGAYDDLIENNTRRIKILEQMAQMLYREWFVNFHFPGHEKVKMVESELGLIPEGWSTETIANVAEVLGGGTPATGIPEYWDAGEVDWYSPSDLTAASSMFMFTSSKRISTLGLKKSSARLFPSDSVMMTSRATIGVVSINRGEACTNQGFITCVPGSSVSRFQIYFWLLENKDKIMSLATGATFKEINKRTFRELPIVVATPDILERFVTMMSPIGDLIENLLRRNLNLRATRDLLLPKLVSGEISVEELEGEAAVAQ